MPPAFAEAWVPFPFRDAPLLTLRDELTPRDEPLLTLRDEPLLTFRDEPLLTLRDEPLLTLRDAPLLALRDEPLLAVRDAPLLCEVLEPLAAQRAPAGRLEELRDALRPLATRRLFDSDAAGLRSRAARLKCGRGAAGFGAGLREPLECA